MRFFSSLFTTQDTLGEGDYRRAERLLVRDGMCVFGMLTLQGGVFITAFALALGASNYEIGLLTTIAFLSQFMQLVGLALLKRFPRRRAVAVLAAGAARLIWIFIILTPFLFAGRGMTFLLQWLIVSAVIGAIAAPAWNSLLRDIVPEQVRGRVFSRRIAFGTGLALILTLGGGYFIDLWKATFPDAVLYGYACLFTLGLILGLGGVFAMSRLPEPAMEVADDQSLFQLVAMPLRDSNFRRVLSFMLLWSLAVNMAAPFFIVYMLERIGLSIFMVTVLTVTSQLTNIVFLGIWGRLADRFSNKSVLASSGLLYLLAIMAWCFTTMPERYVLTMPLLFMIQIVSGMAVAGVSISSGNVALKLSPAGNAHGYMTVFGLAAAITGGIAPLLGGLLADFFALRQFTLSLNWSSPGSAVSVSALNLKALDFVFLLAFGVGLYALHRLGSVKEEGTVTEREVMDELLNEIASPIRTFSSVAGLRRIASRPFQSIARIATRNRSRQPQRATSAAVDDDDQAV
jgi:MFS family permease